jgi:hypothetical protein
MGPWDRFVIMLLPIIFILSITGIIILRPLSKRLGDLLELMVRDRSLDSSYGIHEVLQRLDAIEARIARIEEARGIESRLGQEARLGLGDGETGE